MKLDIQEKLLGFRNENGILYKIKEHLKSDSNKEMNKTHSIKNSNEIENEENSFMDRIRMIENEETKLLKLQKQYRNGEIKEEELSEEQIHSLCKLYEIQIANLEKSNRVRKYRLLEYRKKLQANN